MEPSKEAIAVRITRLNRQILGKVTSGSSKLNKKTIDREALLDALTVLYDECNDDPVKKSDDLVKTFVDRYRSTLAELRRTRVCLSDFEILQTIGRGHFGEVHMVREKETSDVYAMKTMRKEEARKRATTEDERDVLANANGPWMPRLQYAFQDNSNLYLVMELCSGGDLAGLLARRSQPLAERDAAFYVAETAHALKALHGLGYVHRDIKPHNILLDRCGHVKLGDFGSCARLAEGGALGAGTADYAAPELLAAADCARRHSVCLALCRGIAANAISACDYWSLGVVAFELVTLKRPFSTGEEDSIAEILANIQKYEREPDAEPPFEPAPNGPSAAWRSLVAGLLRVAPARRYNYLDTLQHAALAHAHLHSIRDQAPPWVPTLRGAEDAAYFRAEPRDARPPSAAPFRSRPPFAGQLPFIGYSYVAPEENEDSHSGGFNASHDCTAIDLATFKSAEKLAAMRGREIASLQNKLAAAEAAAGAAAEKTRRDADAEAERTRARLQAEITALSLQNTRLERQIEVEKEERMALQRTNQELSSGLAERSAAELAAARANAALLQAERDSLRDCTRRLEARVAELQAECARAASAADEARVQHMHYKDSVAKERALRRQTLTGGEVESREMAARLAAAEAATAREVRAREQAATRLADLEDEYGTLQAEQCALQAELDDARTELAAVKMAARLPAAEAATAREVRAREQAANRLADLEDEYGTLQAEQCALQAELDDARTELAAVKMAARLAAAEAATAREVRAREQAANRLADLEDEYGTLQAEQCALQAELDDARTELAAVKESMKDKQHSVDSSANYLKEAQQQLAQERVRSSSLQAQVKELERGLQEAARREASLEEQCSRTEARLNERLDAAETRVAAAVGDEARHREKVNTLEQLVRQLEREVSALESRGCAQCAARADKHEEAASDTESHEEAASDTESVTDAAHAQLALLKEQLERAENQLQARAEEMANLRQEARTANLARWRKEREYNDLSVEAKSAARDLKRLEERLSHATEARRTAEQKASSLQNELATLKPQYEQASKEAERAKEQLEKLRKAHETAVAEVDRSRNDIRKLKSELQYSEKRRLHAEEEEELSSRERAQLRDELNQLRAQTNDVMQNNKALQEACSLLEEQLTDLEKLADIHEIKNKDLENETQRLRSELEACRSRLQEAEQLATERGTAASLAAQSGGEARDQARHAHCQLQLLRERLESREGRVAELESRVAALEGERSATDAALSSALRRVRDLQEESSALRTRAHDHHAHALQLQAQLADAQEELSAAREAAEAAAAWWRTRETKADATLRQQAKLIDFLQAKVEEAGRKKCSLSNKLFGRSGRRSAASPPLRRANRELREEVERLRAKLASRNGEVEYPPTPRREKPKSAVNGRKSIDTPDGPQDNNTVQVVWSDGVRERARARVSGAALVLVSGEQQLRAKLLAPDAGDLPQNEANRAFIVKMESPARCERAAIVCGSLEDRRAWLSRLQPAPAPPGYHPSSLCLLDTEPAAALHVAVNASQCPAEMLLKTKYVTASDALTQVAYIKIMFFIGCIDGLHSLRGPIRLEFESDVSPPRLSSQPSVQSMAAANGRALLVYNGALVHAGLLALGSSLRRSSNLKPTVEVSKVRLPDTTPPHLVKAISSDIMEGPCAVVACGRRVFLLRFDASTTEFRIARSLTVDRAPSSLLLTSRALYIAGEKPLKVLLPSGALEAFGMEEPIIAAAARKHSPPKAILLVRDKPTEILLCYAECGVFVDENGRRTRSEDPKWSSAARAWEYVHPFLYVAGDDRVTVLYVTDDVFRAPPCTCDTASLASTASECYMPEIFNLKVNEPALLGTAPNGVIIRTKDEEGHRVSVVEGMAAFKSVGASVESLETISDSKGSSTDLAQSITDLTTPQDVSQESVEVTSGFLADIRKRARQLRNKHRKERTPDDVIKEILTTEVGLKRSYTSGRKSPATVSEFDSDSTESEEKTESPKGTADLCAEMFTRQVRFQ
ncbi:citron Rho-interacting kinase-like [Ostrinia furnacalis]|uniref:citron Rho-interacting kinase-like n=1 Tax=Ostrinia furnacalis TaxID=93504 RepID=UPI00103BB0CE|nr:citron Rho-interacting kinase-like [Ostrinia furnacalis]